MPKKKKEQSVTIGNENPYDKLDPLYQLAVDLRLDGIKYRDIAAQPGMMEEREEPFRESAVRRWFMKGGICYAAFNWKKKVRAMEREELWRDTHLSQLKELATDALTVVRVALRKNNNSQVAIEVLKMVGIEAPKKIDKESLSPEDLALKELLKKYEGPTLSVGPKGQGGNSEGDASQIPSK